MQGPGCRVQGAGFRVQGLPAMPPDGVAGVAVEWSMNAAEGVQAPVAGRPDNHQGTGGQGQIFPVKKGTPPDVLPVRLRASRRRWLGGLV